MSVLQLYEQFKADIHLEVNLQVSYMAERNKAHRAGIDVACMSNWPRYLKETYDRYCDQSTVVEKSVTIIAALLKNKIYLLPDGKYLVAVVNGEYGDRLEERELFGGPLETKARNTTRKEAPALSDS